MTERAGAAHAIIEHEGQRRPATRSLARGRRVYGEDVLEIGGEEWRVWNPYRSKLAAAILGGIGPEPIVDGATVLYLGASTGTTVSHVSDIVGPAGRVFAVEHASRVARELLDRVAAHRPNVTPVMQDARRPREYFSVYGRADVVYSDIAQPDQTGIALANCRAHLRERGWLMLVIKARSIDVTRAPSDVIEGEIARIAGDFDVEGSMGLEPYDRDHAFVLARARGGRISGGP